MPMPRAGGGVPADAFTHADAVEVHKLLGQELGDAAAAAEWKARCAKVRDLSTCTECCSQAADVKLLYILGCRRL